MEYDSKQSRWAFKYPGIAIITGIPGKESSGISDFDSMIETSGPKKTGQEIVQVDFEGKTGNGTAGEASGVNTAADSKNLAGDGPACGATSEQRASGLCVGNMNCMIKQSILQSAFFFITVP